MKIAIWAAVSSKAQAAADKVSIQNQIDLGRAYINQTKGTPAGQYIVPGESRTAYISLSHAEDDIPQLHALLEDARAGKYHLLWVYDLNRFRNLMLQVFEALSGYGIQIYNHDDPINPVHPPEYTAERINAARLNIKLHDIISGQEINTLRKHYAEKMPRRITEKKLHPGLGAPPYGYRKPIHQAHSREAVLEQHPQQVAILHQIKDWFLQDGLSLTAIAQRLNESGTPSPRGKRWWYSIVRYLLANPYYAGIVQFGVTKRNHDRRLRTVTRVKSQAVSAVGKHTPLWDQQTHQRIMTELQRRAKAQPGISTRQLTRLLHCQCGAVMWAQKTPAGKYWRCSTLQPGHSYINDQTALNAVIQSLTQALKNTNTITLPKPQDKRPQLQAQIKDLKAKQKRWLDLYEDGTLDKTTLNTRLEDIKTRLQTTTNLLNQVEQTNARSLSARAAIDQLAQAIEALPEYIQTADPLRVNTTLHTILESITIHKDNTITLHWR